MSYSQGASQGGGFFEGMGAAGGDAAADRRKDSELGLRPVTIRQIQQVQTDVPDMPLIIDEKEVKNVTVVGRVSEYDRKDVFSSFKLDDGTGVIECKMWGAENDAPTVQENGYARVRGILKLFGGTLQISATTVSPVTDPNELVFHNLQAIWSHLYLTKDAAGGDQDHKLTPGLSNDPSPLGRVSAALKHLITENAEGVMASQIRKRVPNMSESEANIALRELADTGHAYSITGENNIELYFPMD